MGYKRKVYTNENRDIETSAISQDCAIFAKIFDKILIERNITTQKIASDTQIGESTISYYRNGKKQPGLSNIITIAKYLNVDCNYLMTGIKAKNNTIHQTTGLSDLSIQKLSRIKKENRLTWCSNLINSMIENEQFETLMFYLMKYATENEKNISYGHYNINTKDIAQTKVQSIFYEIIKSIETEFANSATKDYRFMYRLAESMYKDGRLTKEQYIKTVKEFDCGNFEYSPLLEIIRPEEQQ